MKVAVISLAPTLGKTALISVLGGTYSRSQAKNVAVLSTGDAADNVNIVDVHVRNDDITNPHIFKAMVESSEADDDLFDYGLRQGDENVFIYDIFSSTMHREEKIEFLYSCLDTIPGDINFIEIQENWTDPLAQDIMKRCDCTLVIFDASEKGIRQLNEFREKCNRDILVTCGFVVGKYDPAVISEKNLVKKTGLELSRIMYFPYNLAVKKYMFDGKLDKLAYNIIIGEYQVQMLRTRMLEIMQFLFDTPKRKIIRSVDRWYK